jgi:protoporphyrinogen oxidase
VLNKGRVVIAGAGIAGLTLAYELCKGGVDVTLIEKESSVGGLARSFEYHGGYTFDAGPHRFYTEVPAVLDLIHEVLEDDILTMPRKSGVRMFDRYFEWPLSFADLVRMPFKECFSVGIDMLRREKPAGESFENYILASYGRTLYEIFFKPYTEKFLRLPCREISKHWALTGIDRAVIDSSIKVDNLSSLARSFFKPQPPLQFIYPKSGGIGVFSEKLRSRVLALGGKVVLGSEVSAIGKNGLSVDRVTAGGVDYDCDTLVWTAPISELTELLETTAPELPYLSLLIYNFMTVSEVKPAYQWCYFGADDVPFNRISYPTLFNPGLAPAGEVGICVEVTCRKGEDAWQNPEAMTERIVASMINNGVIRSKGEIRDCRIERVGGAYPIYTLDYEAKLAEAVSQVNRFEGVELLGRTGRFWYNNMDHSIEDALQLSKKMMNSRECK